MRVLMIAPTSFFSDYGGHIRIREEMQALTDKGVDVAVVTYYKGNDVDGLDIRRTSPLPWHTDYEVGSSRHKIAFDAYLAVTSLREARRFRPDVIHGHMHEGALIGGVVGRLLGIPLVFDFQGSLTAEMVDHHFLDRDGRVFPYIWKMEHYITTALPGAVLTSSRLAARLLEDEFGVSADRITELPDCADPVRFDPSRFTYASGDHPLRQTYGIRPEQPVIGYLGLLTDYQGVPHILEAAAQLKACGDESHFLVMGYPNVEHYQLLAAELGVADRVTFTGRVPFDDAPYFLSACDMAVAPKLSATEGSGKLLNYMAMALPTVAYDTPVNHEYLGEAGIYVPRGDVTGLATALQELARDQERRAELGRVLRARAIETFSWPAAADRIIEVYRGLTNDG